MTRKMMMGYAKTIILAFVTALILIIFVVQASYINSGSMRPTLEERDRILVNKFVYRLKKPERFEIIVFRYPVQPNRKFIKRVIGIPGDKIEIKDGVVYINGQLLDENYTLSEWYGNYGPVNVPEGHYFVLGDNRNNSEDSRFWGFVPKGNVIGKAFLTFWPIKRFGFLLE